MPSPSSPLEYRPTPHLILIILFIIFPLIYLCARLVFTSCLILAFVLKSMFSRVLRFLYEEEYISIPTVPRRTPPTPTPSLATPGEEVEDETSGEELVDESDVEREEFGTAVAAKLSKDLGVIAGMEIDQPARLEIQTEGLHDSEHDSGNEEDPSAMSAASTATTATNQTPDIPEVENLQSRDAFEETLQLRHRDNVTRLHDDT